MRLEFNEMSRSSSESLAEITAADEYGAAVIKATESNLSKKGSSVFISHRVDTHHPSRVTPHFTKSFQFKSKLGEKEKKSCTVMWCLIQEILWRQNEAKDALHKREMMKMQKDSKHEMKWKLFWRWKEVHTHTHMLAFWKSPCSRYTVVILTEQPQTAGDPAEKKKPGKFHNQQG